MLDKSKLGARFTCFQCGTKFYDLNRPTPTCPECQADQGEAPAQDFRRMLSSRKRKTEEPPAPEPPKAKDEDDDLAQSNEGDGDSDDPDAAEAESAEPLLTM
jgi:hypothetical protein